MRQDGPESGLRHYVGIPFRVLRRFATALAVLALVISLGFNFAVLTITGVFTATSAVLSSAGLSTVAAREAAEKRVQRKASSKIARKTTERVRRRVANGAARNIASVGGEALPVVGVAVIAAALAYDVKDACDTARDMEGLEAALIAETDPDKARTDAMDKFDCGSLIPGANELPNAKEIYVAMRAAPQHAWDSSAEQLDRLTAIDVTSVQVIWESVTNRVSELPGFGNLQDWWFGPEEATK